MVPEPAVVPEPVVVPEPAEVPDSAEVPEPAPSPDPAAEDPKMAEGPTPQFGGPTLLEVLATPHKASAGSTILEFSTPALECSALLFSRSMGVNMPAVEPIGSAFLPPCPGQSWTLRVTVIVGHPLDLLCGARQPSLATPQNLLLVLDGLLAAP